MQSPKKGDSTLLGMSPSATPDLTAEASSLSGVWGQEGVQMCREALPVPPLAYCKAMILHTFIKGPPLLSSSRCLLVLKGTAPTAVPCSQHWGWKCQGT